MATVKMGGELFGGSISFNFFQLFSIGEKTSTKALFTGADDLTGFKLAGNGFTYDESGTLIDGQLRSVILTDETASVDIAKITGVNFNFATYEDQNPLNGETFFETLLSGSDTIVGSARRNLLEGFAGTDRLIGGRGSDYLDGGAGKDVHTGGKGADVFVFRQGEGNDVVKDFDAVGDGLLQDYFTTDSGNVVDFVKDGKNTQAVLDDGTTITFLDVKFSDMGLEDIAGV